jgi:hypothetical protein
MKIYRYCPPDVVSKMFGRPGYIGFKCDLPKNYNDPFELFLSIDTKEVSVDLVAAYLEIVGEVPQMPTTCFSKRPDVIPMWAHYGRDHAGYVIEVDEARIAKAIALGYLGDMAYSDATGSVDLGLIDYAATTRKFRHAHRVQTIAFQNAYLTKNKCWAYEMERRLVIHPDDITEVGGTLILFIPVSCVTAIILGPKCDPTTTGAALLDHASSIGCPLYQLKIGRASCIPYFSDGSNSYRFNGTTIQPAACCCSECAEPVDADEERTLCYWCLVDEDDKANAALNNPLRMLYAAGLGGHYGFSFADVTPIGHTTLRRPS